MPTLDLPESGIAPVRTGTTLKLVMGDTIAILRPEFASGIDPIICNKWNIGSPDPREFVDPLVGRSGLDDLTNFHGARAFTCSLYLLTQGGQTKEATLDVLRKLSGANARPYLYLWSAAWPAERRMLLRGKSSNCDIGQEHSGYFEMNLEFSCPSGVMESAELLEYEMRPNSIDSEGVYYDISYPLNYGAGSSGGGASIITVGGTQRIYPLYRIYGPTQDYVSVQNADTGDTIRINTDIEAGQYLEIDSNARTAKFGGTVSAYSKIDFANTVWWGWDPGSLRIRLDAGGAGNNAAMVAYYREVWI